MERPDPLVLSNSQAELWMHSERCYWWRHLRRVTLKETGVHLARGDVTHQGLECLYRGLTVAEAMQQLQEDGALRVLERLCEKGDWFSPERLRLALDKYQPILEADMAKYHVLAAELDETLRLDPATDERPFDVEWRGKLDLVVRSKEDDKVYIIDHKTTEKKVDSSYYAERFHNDQQFTSYDWMGGQNWHEAFGGVLVNAFQFTKTIPFNTARFPVARDDWQTLEWMENIRSLSPGIRHAQLEGRRLLADGFREHNPEVLRVFPIRTGYSENFCDYRHLNNSSPELRELIINELYETRESKHGQEGEEVSGA